MYLPISAAALLDCPRDDCGRSLDRLNRLAVVVVLMCLVGCGSHTKEPAETKAPPLPELQAETIVVEPSVWPATVRSQGSLYADEVSAVGTRVAGRVAEVHVDLGDRVAEGDPLASLETEDFLLLEAQAAAQLNQARSALGLGPDDPINKLDPENVPVVRQERAVWEEAKTSVERARALVRQRTLSASEFDLIAVAERVAEARYAAALNGVQENIALIGVRQAELSLTRQRLKGAVIKAPFEGLVQKRTAASGAYVSIGDEIAVLVRINPLRFRGTLPERHAHTLALNQEVRLRIESIAEPRAARITRISPTLDPLSRSLTFEAQIDNPDGRLRTGLFANAEVVVNPEARALVVPRSAIVEFAGTEKVWKVVEGVAGEQEVFTGQRRGDYVEIVNGVAASDVILRDGSQGRIARIVPAKKAGALASETSTSQPLDDAVSSGGGG